MLYDLWRQVVAENMGERALLDSSTERWWTFRELAMESERIDVTDDPFVFPTGNGPDFILALLSGWRSGKIICPKESGPGPEISAVPGKNIVHLKTTSATTGPQKVVAFTDEQLLADCENIVQTMGLRPDWPNISAISLAHSYGFSNLVLPLLLRGIPLVLAPAPLPEMIRRALSMVEECTLPAVPALWQTWSQAGLLSSTNLKLAISAGAPLTLELENAIHEKTGIKLHNFYGSTECGGIAFDRSSKPRGDAALIGRAMEGVDLSTDAEGYLVVKGAAVADGYLSASSPQLKEGCYRTSDLVRLDQGEVFMLGRGDDVINYAGRKVAPELIESAMLNIPGVRDCLVFAADEESSRQKIVACVVMDAGEELDRTSMRRILSGRLEAWQVPREYHQVPDLPVNERGKRSRKEWRLRHSRREPPFQGGSPDKVI